eukprot:s11_g84.t1
MEVGPCPLELQSQNSQQHAVAEVVAIVPSSPDMAADALTELRYHCASEMAASLAVLSAADKEQTMDQYSMKAFASALDVVPMALAENSGLQGIAEMAKVKAVQENTGNAWHGVDCMQTGTTDMWEQNVYEACASKSSQLRLATQVVKMILKIDDVITSGDVIDE